MAPRYGAGDGGGVMRLLNWFVVIVGVLICAWMGATGLPFGFWGTAAVVLGLALAQTFTDPGFWKQGNERRQR